MGLKSYLSANEKKDLIEFVAATGENYSRYLEFCEKRGWRPYSQKYLHTWIQRRRAKVQEMRATHREEVRRLSIYDRERRIMELERAAEIIKARVIEQTDGEHECPECSHMHFTKSDMIVKLLEQQRKILEAIARERNEWQKEDEKKDGFTARDKLRAASIAALGSAKETQIIDGVVVVGGN